MFHKIAALNLVDFEVHVRGFQTQSGEANGYRKATVYLKDGPTCRDPKKFPYHGFFIKGGYRIPANSPLTDATIRILKMWRNAFNKTQLALTFHYDSEDGYGNRINDEALRLGFAMLNTGLNGKDHSGGRKQFSQWKAQYEVKVGWAGITNPTTSATTLDSFKEGIGAP